MALFLPKFSSMLRSPGRPSSLVLIATFSRSFPRYTYATSTAQEKINDNKRKLFVWGTSLDGQLGISDDDEYLETPTEVEGMGGQEINQMSCGDTHALAVLKNGQLWSWGASEHGQNGTRRSSRVPQQVPHIAAHKIEDSHCGRYHSLIRSSDGDLLSFGSGQQGQLGHGGNINEKHPRRIDFFHSRKLKVSLAAAGWIHSMAFVDGSKELFVWGGSSYGQLGLGDLFNEVIPTPIKELTGKKVTGLAGALYHSAAIVDEKEIFTWGRNTAGQLGYPEKGSDFPKRVSLPSELSKEKLVQICCGLSVTIIRTDLGRLFMFGTNERSATDSSAATQFSKPTLIDFFEKQSLRVTNLAVSASHFLVTTHDGAVWCWGTGTDYQLGNGKRSASSIPLRVSQLFEQENFRATGVACSLGCSFAFGETL